jgi:hypothetical protein
MHKIAARFNVGTSAVQRIKAEMGTTCRGGNRRAALDGRRHVRQIFGSASLTWRVTEDVMTLFGVELVMRVNPELEAKMQDRYERRDERAVRPPKRISAKLLELAQPIIQQKLGRAGGLKRAACLPAKQRSRIARAAAISRWKQHGAAAKAAAHSEGLSP